VDITGLTGINASAARRLLALGAVVPPAYSQNGSHCPRLGPGFQPDSDAPFRLAVQKYWPDGEGSHMTTTIDVTAEPRGSTTIELIPPHQRSRLTPFGSDPRATLLDALASMSAYRHGRGLRRGECGACTVLIDGRRANACLNIRAHAAGREITTIEGLASGVNSPGPGRLSSRTTHSSAATASPARSLQRSHS